MLFIVPAVLYYSAMTILTWDDWAKAKEFDFIPSFSGYDQFSVGILFYDPTTEQGLRFFDSSPDIAALDWIALFIAIFLVIFLPAMLWIRS